MYTVDHDAWSTVYCILYRQQPTVMFPPLHKAPRICDFTAHSLVGSSLIIGSTIASLFILVYDKIKFSLYQEM